MPDVFVAPEEETTTKPKKEKATTPASSLKSDPGQGEDDENTIRMLTSFCQFPKDIRFENQEDDELVHLFLRRHIITNLRWVTTVLLLSLLPLLFPFFLQTLEPTFLSIPLRFGIFFLFFYYLILFGYGFVHFITWFYNVGIVTQIRVVDIDISHITHKNIAAVSIHDLVDVAYIQHGFLHNMFDYGDIHLQTEGLKPNFEFHGVPHPAKVADIISDLVRGGRNE